MPSLSEILKRQLASGKPSKALVAAKLNVSEKTIENYINGKRQPKPDALVKLSELLKFSLSELSEQNVPREQFHPLELNDDGDTVYHVKDRDLAKEIGKIRAWQAGVDATLSVLISEITPLIAGQTGKSHAAVFSQMKKDIEAETSVQIAQLSKR